MIFWTNVFMKLKFHCQSKFTPLLEQIQLGKQKKKKITVSVTDLNTSSINIDFKYNTN